MIDIPKTIRNQLRRMGYRRRHGFEIDPWICGKRYRTFHNETVYCENDQVLSVEKNRVHIFNLKRRTNKS